MNRPKHIAVAVDFSDHSRDAAKAAYDLARAWGADLTLINAREPFGSHYPGSAALLPALIVDQIEEHNREQALEQLGELREALEDGVALDERPKLWVTAALGEPGPAICAAALEAAADLIVIGTRGMSQVRSWLLGSVSRAVTGAAHCPVLVTRGAPTEALRDGFRQVTIGVDHTELTRPLVEAVRSMLASDGKVVLLKAWHVPKSGAAGQGGVSSEELYAEGIAWEASRLDELRRDVGMSEELAAVQVGLGKPAQELLAHARTTNADLIAVGSHQRDSIFEKVLGTNAERILHHSPVPVLVFPAASLARARTRVQGQMAEFVELNDRDCKSYLIVSQTGDAMIVDPLLENLEPVASIVTARELNLKYVVDTHVHADHISGGPRLADELGATYVVHKNSGSSCAGLRVEHGDVLALGKLEARVLYSPGHAADAISLSFPDRLLTGDFLFIGDGGAGRTDLPGGDPGEHWDALRELRHLPPTTLIFPGHDYHGRTFSTLAEERINNPRLAPRTREQYVEWLESQDLGPAEWMVGVIAANDSCKQTAADIKSHASATCEVGGTAGEPAAVVVDHIGAGELAELMNERDVLVLDVREAAELEGPLGEIEGARHVPLAKLSSELDDLVSLARGSVVVAVCRRGSRSDSAAARLRVAGVENVYSLQGGMEAWREFEAQKATAAARSSSR